MGRGPYDPEVGTEYGVGPHEKGGPRSAAVTAVWARALERP